MNLELVCETCHTKFESTRQRRFCSVICKARSPEFRPQMLANLEKARASYTPGPKKGEIRPCVQCGEMVYLTQTMIKRGAKFCGRPCYRLWLAARFGDKQVTRGEALEHLQKAAAVRTVLASMRKAKP